MLNNHDVEQIHNTSMKLLANVGVQFPSDEAVATFEQHGIKTDGHTVYLSEEQVMSALALTWLSPMKSLCSMTRCAAWCAVSIAGSR